jgi:hypothetical protein
MIAAEAAAEAMTGANTVIEDEMIADSFQIFIPKEYFTNNPITKIYQSL